MAYLKNRQRVDIALGEVVYDDVDEEDERYQKWKSKALNVLGELVLPDNDPVVAPSDALGARSPNKFIDPDASSPAVSAKKAKRDKKNKKRRVEDGLELNSEGYPRLSNHWHKTLSADLCIATVMIVVALVLVILPLDGGDTLFARVANASTNSSDVLDLSNTLHRPNFWLFVTLHHPLFFLFAVLYMYEYLKHSCNVFTAKWQIVSAMVGVAQLLVMNIVAYFATNRFRTTTRVEASVILIFTTASSAFAPFACPLVLMILKKRAINKLQVIAFAWRFFFCLSSDALMLLFHVPLCTARETHECSKSPRGKFGCQACCQQANCVDGHKHDGLQGCKQVYSSSSQSQRRRESQSMAVYLYCNVFKHCDMVPTSNIHLLFCPRS